MAPYLTYMKVGQIVRVEFWDHASHGTPLKCIVYGKIIEKNRLYVMITQWESDDPEHKDGNEDFVSVLRSCITQWDQLAPVAR